MKSSSKKSAAKWILSGFTAFTLTISLAGCSQTAGQSPELEKTNDASLVETAEYVPASAEGPAQNVPEPRLPVSATEDSEEGAEATLHYFIALVDYARASGNTKALEAISREDCDFCAENIAQWSEIYRDGNWIVSEGELSVKVLESWSGHDEDRRTSAAEFNVELYQPASFLYEDEKLNENDSVESENVSQWHASLLYDGTGQRWEMEWMYLSEHDSERSQ